MSLHFQTRLNQLLRRQIAVRAALVRCGWAIAFCLSMVANSGAEPLSSDALVITNVHIVSGDRASTGLFDVVVEDGKITHIQKHSNKAKFEGSRHIDGKLQYLIPGLIDAHVHLDGVPGYIGDEKTSAAETAMLHEARQQMPRSYAYFGFTTVLDLTGDADFIAKWNQQVLAPQAYFCSPVTIPNGYPASWMDKDLQFQVPAAKMMLFDPAQPNVYPANFVAEQHSPVAVVQAAKQAGASCIKVFYETGFGPKKNLPVPSVELIRAVVKEARQNHMPVYLHGNSQAAYEFALQTGVDTLVHGLWHETKNVDASLNQMRLQQMAKEIKQAGIAVQPTMQVLYGEQEETNPAFFQHPYVAEAIPAALIQWYQSEKGQWMKNILTEEVAAEAMPPAAMYQAIRKMYQKPLNTVRQMTSYLHGAGARLQFGSDTPSGPFYTQFPGMNGRWEMDRWLEAGMSLSELFQAMTSENARALGLQDRIGSIAVGKQADLLLLEKNPLESIQAYDQIRFVILRGVAVERANLSARQLKTSP